MKNTDFDKSQIYDLKEFARITKRCIKTDKISPTFLLYLVSALPDEHRETVFTKSNKTVLKSLLPAKKRLHIDFILKELENL